MHKKTPLKRCLLSLDCLRQSDHVLDIGVIEALELFDLIVHLSPQAGCGCVVDFVEGVDAEREEANDSVFGASPGQPLDGIGARRCYRLAFSFDRGNGQGHELSCNALAAQAVIDICMHDFADTGTNLWEYDLCYHFTIFIFCVNPSGFLVEQYIC